MAVETLDEYFQRHPTIDNLPKYGFIFQLTVLLITSFGTISNLAILLSTTTRKDINPHLVGIISLCVPDFLHNCITATILGCHLAYNSWTSPIMSAKLVCIFDTFICCLLMHASGLSLVVLAAERYVVIIKGWYQHDKIIYGWVGIQWLYSLVISIISVSFPDTVQVTVTTTHCQPNFTYHTTSNVALGITFIAAVNFAFVGICYFYYSIYHFYRTRKSAKGDNLAMSTKERKLFVRLLTITGFYVTLYTPWVIAMIYELVSGELSPYWFTYMYIITVCLNSSCNPLILYNLDSSIKFHFDQFFGLTRQADSNYLLQDQQLAPERNEANVTGDDGISKTEKHRPGGNGEASTVKFKSADYKNKVF